MLATGELDAGAASANITPPLGVPMAGYAARQGVARAVLDDLTAHALVLRVQNLSIALVSCDLLFVSESLATSVRTQVFERTGIPAENVLLAATHTHAGPAYSAQPLCDAIARAVVDVIAEAQHALQPARVAAGKGYVNANLNRRKPLPDGTMGLAENPAGIADREVSLLRVDDLHGTPLALVVNYAAHPVCLRPNNLAFSADWVGAMRRTLASVTEGAPVLFLQGASGDLIPCERGDARSAQRVGQRIAGEAIKIFATLQTTPKLALSSSASDPLHHIETLVAIDEPSRPTTLGIARTIVGLPLDPSLTSDTIEKWLAAQSESASVFYRVWFEREQTFPAELQAFQIGDAVLLAFPAEVFTAIGLAIKAHSNFPLTLFVSCANDDRVPYVPTADAFARGGYEVEQARHGWGMPAGLAVTAADTMVERAITLINLVWKSWQGELRHG